MFTFYHFFLISSSHIILRTCFGCQKSIVTNAPLPYCVFLFSLEGYFAIISPRFYARMFSYLDFNISTCLHISMIT